jgi:hypothetical protein
MLHFWQRRTPYLAELKALDQSVNDVLDVRLMLSRMDLIDRQPAEHHLVRLTSGHRHHLPSGAQRHQRGNTATTPSARKAPGRSPRASAPTSG